MAAKTAGEFNLNTAQLRVLTVLSGATNDHAKIAGPGVLVISAKDGSGNEADWSYAKLDVKLSAGYDENDTSIVYDGGVANQRPAGGFGVYNEMTGECMYVIKDSAPAAVTGTLTVRRGAWGTTAAAITDNDVLRVFTTIVIDAATPGILNVFVVKDLPEDPATQILG